MVDACVFPFTENYRNGWLEEFGILVLCLKSMSGTRSGFMARANGDGRNRKSKTTGKCSRVEMPGMRRIVVYGPAYLDRVVHVDRPLLREGVIDGSFEGTITGSAPHWIIRDAQGRVLNVERPASGQSGECNDSIIALDRPLSDRGEIGPRTVIEFSDSFDLGGMGSGYAKAFGGELISALGPVATRSIRLAIESLSCWLATRSSIIRFESVIGHRTGR